MRPRTIPVVFTPGNEPYLGRELLYRFDELISSAMEQNASTAPRSHGCVLSDHQEMAGQVIAQALSITLSIRELIRQGYLFGAHVLLRALVERAAILLYIHHYPNNIERWKRGWHQGDARPCENVRRDSGEATAHPIDRRPRFDGNDEQLAAR
jgi:hypothetical protein